MSVSERQLTLDDLRLDAARRFDEAGIEAANRESRLLLCSILKCEQSDLIASGRKIVTSEDARVFETAVLLRLTGRPIHRIIGEKLFMTRTFLLDDDVLEPRPETELLVERVLEDLPEESNANIAEIGVGSGAVIVSVLAARNFVLGSGTDLSDAALRLTERNAKRFGVSSRLDLFKADCLEGIDAKFDALLSNPPYIASDEISALAREVRDHDPWLALDGGNDGLQIYRKIFASVRPQLNAGGKLYLETGHGQHSILLEIAGSEGWKLVSRHLDLAGRERLLVLQ